MLVTELDTKEILPSRIVRALIDDERDHERQNQNRDFAVGLGGEQQHHDDDDGNIDHDDVDLMVDRLFLRVAEVGGDVDVVGRKRLFHGVQRLVRQASSSSE